MSSQRERALQNNEEINKRESAYRSSTYGDNDGRAASLRFVLGVHRYADFVLLRVHCHKSREAEGVCDEEKLTESSGVSRARLTSALALWQEAGVIAPAEEGEYAVSVSYFGSRVSEEFPERVVLGELEEESGAIAGKIEHLGEIYTTVAIFDEKIQLYMATDLKFINAHPDEDEFLEVTRLPLKELVKMVMNGEIKDSKTQIALLKAEKYFYGEK